MPSFNPTPWNATPAIHLNNCYNYALNRLDNVVRNPGMLAGQNLLPWHFGVGAAVACLAVADGLQFSGLVLPILFQTPDRWPVALVVAPPWDERPCGDYHWYRRDDNGTWSHKAGLHADANDIDDNGQRIADPFTCARGRYLYFIGFFVVDRALVKP